MNEKTLLLSAAMLVSAVFTAAAWSDVVRLHGATTVQNVVVNPYREAVQAAQQAVAQGQQYLTFTVTGESFVIAISSVEEMAMLARIAERHAIAPRMTVVDHSLHNGALQPSFYSSRKKHA